MWCSESAGTLVTGGCIDLSLMPLVVKPQCSSDRALQSPPRFFFTPCVQSIDTVSRLYRAGAPAYVRTHAARTAAAVVCVCVCEAVEE